MRLDEWILVLVFCVAPLIMGGRSELGRAVYVLLVGTLFIQWTLTRPRTTVPTWTTSGVGWLLVAGLIVLALQVAPMHADWLLRVSPSIAQLLPLWGYGESAAPQLGHWNRLSLDPHATIFALVVYLAHATLFLLLVQRLQSEDDVSRLLKLLALATAFIAAVACLQYFTGTQRFMWVFEHPSRDANRTLSGPFENGNHFAHLLALGIAPMIWWLFQSLQPAARGPTGNRVSPQRYSVSSLSMALLVGLGTVIFAGLLARSRGGILMIMMAGSLCCIGFIRIGTMPKRVYVLLGVAAGVVLVALFVHGSDAVSSELRSLTSGSLDELDYNEARQRIWQANLDVFRMFPVLGTGVGSHAKVYKLVYNHPSKVEYSHAENGYLNLMTETGSVGIGLLVCGIVACLGWLWRGVRHGSNEHKQMTLVVASGIAVSLAHSIFDFPWYLASCMSFAVALCACACYLGRTSQVDHAVREVPTSVMKCISWVGYVSIAASVSILVGPTMASLHYDHYRTLSSRAKRATARNGLQARKLGEWTPQHEAEHELNRKMVHELSRALAWDPNYPAANLRMASTLVSSFELLQQFNKNAMSLKQIRDATIASKFSVDEERAAWLQRAIGENVQMLYHAQRYAHRGLARSPLDARAYMVLANLAFLQGDGPEVGQELRHQALRTRPYDADIMFDLGSELALAGQIEQAITMWKHAFEHDEDCRKPIMQALATAVPAELFVQWFQLRLNDLSMLYQFYQEQGMEYEARCVGPLLIAALEDDAGQKTGTHAASPLIQSVAVARDLADGEKALANAWLAVERAPNHYDAHRVLAQQLMIEQQYDRAIEELSWCVRCRPSDGKLKQTLTSAHHLRRQQVTATMRTTAYATAPAKLSKIESQP